MGRLALRRSQKAAGPREILIRCKTGKAVMTTVLPVGLHSAKTLRVRGWGALNVSIRKTLLNSSPEGKSVFKGL